MLETQLASADLIREFIKSHGLKNRYVAHETDIPESVFSRFLNHRGVLTVTQYTQLMDFFEAYLRKIE